MGKVRRFFLGVFGANKNNKTIPNRTYRVIFIPSLREG